MRTFLAVVLLASLPALAARDFVDDAGRKVSLPDKVERVYAAGPPASVLVFALAPDTLDRLDARLPRPTKRQWIPEKYAQLPELGRLTGRGNTANVEVVLQAKPDLIVDVGSTNATFASLADRVQQQTGIPYILLDGRLETTAQQIEKLAVALGVEARGKELSGYARSVYRRPASEDRDGARRQAPRGVLRARSAGTHHRAQGLDQRRDDRVPRREERRRRRRPGGLTNVGLEQVVLWDPPVIVTNDPNFYREVWKLPVWNSVDGGAQEARLPLAAPAVRLVRLSARRQPPDRPAVALGDPLSRSLPPRPEARRSRRSTSSSTTASRRRSSSTRCWREPGVAPR